MNALEQKVRETIRSDKFEDRAAYGFNLWMYCFLAGVANVCGQTAGHPFDMMKVRLQLQPSSTTPMYRGPIHGLISVAKSEGRVGVYRGWRAAILREFVYSGMRLGLYEPIKVALGATDPAHTPLYLKIAAGCIAGCISATLTNALDVVKVIHSSPPCVKRDTLLHRGAHVHPVRHLAHLYAAGGLRSWFVGVGPNVLRGVVVNSAQVPAYDQTKHSLLNARLMTEGAALHFVASLTASLVAVAITNPIDVVKTHMMAAAAATSPSNRSALAAPPVSPPSAPAASIAAPPTVSPHATPATAAAPSIHRSATAASASPSLTAARHAPPSGLATLRSLLAEGGWRSLYRGAVASWLRLGPHTIVTFVTFEALRGAVGVSPL